MLGRSLYRRLFWPVALWLVATALALPLVMAGLVGLGVSLEVAGLVGQVSATTSWLSAAWFGERLFRVLVNSGERPVPRLLSDMVAIGLFGSAAIVVLASVFHQPVGALITTSGVVVAVLGFSVRDLIGDIFAGVSINMERPYGLNDWLEIPPITQVARVVEINWRATRLLTLDGITMVVPNGLMARSRFNNFSKPRRSIRVLLPVVLGFDVPSERAFGLMRAAVRATPSVMRQPSPDVVIDSFTDFGVRYLVRFWVAEYDLMVITRSRVYANIQRHLDMGGVPLRHRRHDLLVANEMAAEANLEDRRLSVLRHIEMFRALDEDNLNQLCDGLTVRHEIAGAAVVVAGEAGNSLFLVVEGLLEVRGGEGEVLAMLGPGEVFGEMSLLTGAPRSATVVTTTEAVLFEVFDRQLRPIFHSRPDLAEALGTIVEQRQRANLSHADDNSAEGATAPVGQPLMHRIRDFFGLSKS